MSDGVFGQYKNGGPFLFLVDGMPANGWYEYSENAIAHYVNGTPHNATGPACVTSTGRVIWYVDGEELKCQTQQEFLQLIKLKAFW